MFGLGFTEILVILCVALLVLGPDKLPGVAKSIGKTLGQFQRGLDDFKRELMFPRLDSDILTTPPPQIPRQGPRGDTCESIKIDPAGDGASTPNSTPPTDSPPEEPQT